MEGIKRTLLVIASIFVAIVLVLAGFYYVSTWKPSINARRGVSGPQLVVKSLFYPGSTAFSQSLAANSFSSLSSNVSVSVFSVVPDSLLTSSQYNGRTVNLSSYSVTNNPFDIELFSGISGSNGTLYGYLNSSFYGIETQWRGLLSNVHDQVSLSIHASLTRMLNNSIYVYNYYNNIQYSPFVNNTVFHASVFFNLSNPSYVIGTNTSAAADRSVNPYTVAVPQSTVYPCNGPAPTSYDLINETTVTGPLPISIANMTTGNSTSYADMAASYTASTMELSFNSASTDINDSSAAMSTTPSFNGTNNQFTTTQASIAAFPNTTTYPNTSFVMIYVPNATYRITNILEVNVVYIPSQHECYNVYGPIYSDGKITNIPSIEFLAEPVPSAIGAIFHRALGTKLITNESVAVGHSAQLTNMESMATGWSNAQDAFNKALAVASAFSAALGTGLAIADALDFIPDVGPAAGVAETLNALATAVGDITTVLSLMNSISFSSTYAQSIQTVSSTNDALPGQNGNLLYMALYEFSLSDSITINGTAYSPNMPLPYIVCSS